MEKSDYTAFRKQVGLRIRSGRAEQGLSLRKLGLMTGIDYAYLSNIENGRVNFTIDTLLKISDALGIDVPNLLAEQGGSSSRLQD